MHHAEIFVVQKFAVFLAEKIKPVFGMALERFPHFPRNGTNLGKTEFQNEEGIGYAVGRFFH